LFLIGCDFNPSPRSSKSGVGLRRGVPAVGRAGRFFGALSGGTGPSNSGLQTAHFPVVASSWAS